MAVYAKKRLLLHKNCTIKVSLFHCDTDALHRTDDIANISVITTTATNRYVSYSLYIFSVYPLSGLFVKNGFDIFPKRLPRIFIFYKIFWTILSCHIIMSDHIILIQVKFQT